MKMAGFVYIIGPKDGPFKVGSSKTVRKRLGELQVGHHLPLSVHSKWPHTSPREVELYAQGILEPYKMRGEWFSCDLSEARCAVELAIKRSLADGPLFTGWVTVENDLFSSNDAGQASICNDAIDADTIFDKPLEKPNHAKSKVGSAPRVALLRRRRNSGKIVIDIEIDHDACEEMLIGGGLLDPGRHTRNEIRLALSRQIELLTLLND